MAPHTDPHHVVAGSGTTQAARTRKLSQSGSNKGKIHGSNRAVRRRPKSFLSFMLGHTLFNPGYMTRLSLSSLLIYICFFMPSPWFIYTYLIVYPMLYVHRFFSFRRQKWHFYLIDFCYMANALLYTYCVLYHVMDMSGNNDENSMSFWLVKNFSLWLSSNETRVQSIFFVIVWLYCNGPVMFGVYVYRNSFVFHDLDKLTSVFLHLAPPGITWIIRWHYGTSAESMPLVSIDAYSIVLGWLMSLLITLAYNIVYNYGVRYLWATRADKDELEHSFTYQKCQPQYAFFNEKHGHLSLKWQLAWFSYYSDLYIFGCGLLSVPLLFSYHVHTLAIVAFYAIALYNGFTFHQKEYRDYRKKLKLHQQLPIPK